MPSFIPTAAALRALAPTTLLVQGLRGAGKTTLIERLIALEPTEAWGGLSTGAPASGRVRFAAAPARVDAPADPAGARLAWLLAVVVEASAAAGVAAPEPAAMSRRDSAAAALATLDAAHAALIGRGESLVLLYDEPEGPIGPLLSLWLVLHERYRRLRARIFLRPESLAGAELSRPEQRTVLQRSVELVWSAEELLRVLATDSPRGGTERDPVWWAEHPVFGPLPEAAPGPRGRAKLAEIAGLEPDDEAPDRLLDRLRGRRGQVTPGVLLSVRALAGPTWAGLEAAAAAVGARALPAQLADLDLAGPAWPLPAPPDTLAEQAGPQLAALTREGILVPEGELLDLAPLYRPAR